MGTTLDSITDDPGIRVVHVVAIEGYQYLLTNGDPSAVVTAWSGTDWSSALGGLASLDLTVDEELNPWEPLSGGRSTCHFYVMDASGTGADTFGIDTHKKAGGVSSKIAGDVDPDDTTIDVLSDPGFPSSGTVYLGAEAIGYTSISSAQFSSLTRGKWSPFTTSAGGRYARNHRLSTTMVGLPPEASRATTVRTLPTEWEGRWVGIWTHAVRGSTLDVKAQAHLEFAGRIVSVQDTKEGFTLVECQPVMDIIAQGTVYREPFRASVKPGVFLNAGREFTMKQRRTLVAGGTTTVDFTESNPLTVVPSGASGANEIDEGIYTPQELEEAINGWLASERSSSRTLYRSTYTYAAPHEGGYRGALYIADPTTSTTTNISRWFELHVDSSRIRHDLGWADDPPGMTGHTKQFQKTFYSTNSPMRASLGWVTVGDTVQVPIESVTGTYVNQVAFLNPTLYSAGFTTGILRIAGQYFICDTPTATYASPDGVVNIRRIHELNELAGVDAAKLEVPYDDSSELAVEQVLLLEGDFRTLLMSLLTSTGVANYNSSVYDLLPEHVGLAIPYSVLTSTLETELGLVPEGLSRTTIRLEKSTKLREIFHGDFVLRLIDLIWKCDEGRVAVTGWSTPTDAASASFTDADKAMPVNVRDSQRTIGVPSDKWLANEIKIEVGASIIGGDQRPPLHIIDRGSVDTFGPKAITIKAPNFGHAGNLAGTDIYAILPHFVGSLAMLTQPVIQSSVPAMPGALYAHSPGTMTLWTDDFARSIVTGQRSIAATPTLVVGRHRTLGTPRVSGTSSTMEATTGELNFVRFAMRTLAPYSPSAQIDDTATTAPYDAGYDSSGLVIRCYAHAFSETSEPVDASRFEVNDAITVVEADPDDPASPLSWNTTVDGVSSNDITIHDALTGWDNTKAYIVISREYSVAEASQQTDCYQADDADFLVEDARDAYGFIAHGVGQTSAYTASVSTTLPARHATMDYGDGRPVHVAGAAFAVRALNNLVDYKTAVQSPHLRSESITWTTPPSGQTYQLIEAGNWWFAPGYLSVNDDRKLYVAPYFKSDDGTSCSVRITLCRRIPDDDQTYDVDRPAPYTSATFTTTSTSYVIPTAQGLSITHCDLAAGFGILLIEITNHVVFYGLPECRLGPKE